MVYLAWEFCRRARFLGVAACLKSWGPFLVLFTLAVRLRVPFCNPPHTRAMGSLNPAALNNSLDITGDATRNCHL